MKKTELKNLKTKKIDELFKLARDRRLEIGKTLVKMAGGQEKNLKKAKNLKKELAQMLTTIREMEIVQKLQKIEAVEKVAKVAKPK